MSIEKMSLVSVEGPVKRVNRALMKSCEAGCFHIIPSFGSPGEEAGSQHFSHLKSKNLFSPLVTRMENIASLLRIKLTYAKYDDVRMSVAVDFAKYIKDLETKLAAVTYRKEDAEKELSHLIQSGAHVDLMTGMNADFQRVYRMKYIKLRFGRLPADSYPKLQFFEDRQWIFFPFETEKRALTDYIWGVYFTPSAGFEEVDEMFRSLYFERVRMPDFLVGTAEEAHLQIEELRGKMDNVLESVYAEVEVFKQDTEQEFRKIYSKLRALSDSFDLRSNAAVVGGRFFISGYVPKKSVVRFTETLSSIEEVSVVTMPPGRTDTDVSYFIPPPVKLKNNRFVRPFEMFVKMYGLPGYGNIDPTPFVALTYMILYGVMFADVGQGLFVSLLGLIIGLRTHFKQPLAPIMTRIGFSAALFGALNGSVFGNEEILTPFFRWPTVYTALGFSESAAPTSLFQISTTLLIGALGLGFLTIVVTMVLNVVSSIRIRDYTSGFLGPSGVAGLVFYVSVVAGGAAKVLGVKGAFSLEYVLLLIVLPLLIMMFAEPITKAAEYVDKRIHREGVGRNSILLANIAASRIAGLAGNTGNSAISAANPTAAHFTSFRYVKYQCGSMSLSSYGKLSAFSSRNFFFFPFDSDGFRVSGVYLAPAEQFPGTDRLMTLLGFRKERPPWELAVPKPDDDGNNTAASDEKEPKTRKSHGSIVGFIGMGLLELFEAGLTYLSNTMSFMRIGGFILSHAGLMLVVEILSEMFGGHETVGGIITIIVGNLFVIGMEGFLVGIQALRLEYYEMFSRFYRGDGKPFEPIVLDLNLDTSD